MTTNLQAFKRAIARVEGSDGKGEPAALGTAFYVGSGYALSARHVVADLGSDPPAHRAKVIELNFIELGHRTTAQPVAHDAIDDWAILQCDDPPQVEAIDCGGLPAKGAAWTTFGYPDINVGGLVMDGTVTDQHGRDPIGPASQRVSAIQLFVEQAGSGSAPSLHGFSGAPCLVDGKAVGLLRSTLTTTALDGRGASQSRTEAGTAFVCPASAIVERAAPHDRVRLPGNWSRESSTSDFVVIVSTYEREAEQRLMEVAAAAHEKLPGYSLDAPMALDAEEQVASEAALLHAVRLLCRARVAVFDATGFEPAVMLLLGIRAAVRRGVTILSIGGRYVLGDRIDVPFNLLDANIVSHSTAQDASGDESTTPIPMLAKRIDRGLRDINSPHYFDLPVFEAVRRLPARRRGVRPADSGVLMLCSFAPDYTKKNWDSRIKRAFKNQLGSLRAQRTDRTDPDEGLGVARSFELNSPQLVSRAIYEEIRRAQACVVDLTGWSANVLFELGVRLAVTRHPTVCMIERNAVALKGAEAQCANLLSLLVPAKRRYDVTKPYLKEDAYALAYGPKAVPADGIAAGVVYQCVEKQLQIDGEPAARPVYRELLDSSQLFARLTLPAGKTKPVGLFPGNRALTDREEQADFERLLAAWLFLVYPYGEDAALQDAGERGAALREAMAGLYGRHMERLQQLAPGVLKRLGRLQGQLEAK